MLRRTAVCLCVLFALAGAASASAALCVEAFGSAALTDGNGVELLPFGSVDSAFVVREGALYAAGRRGAYRLYDEAGQVVGDGEFSMIHDAGDALVFMRGGRCGAMDAEGIVLIPAEWTQLTGDGHGGWLALDGDTLDDRADEIVHLDADGTARRTGVYTASGLSEVRCDRMPFMASDGRFGAVDAAGSIAVEPIWRSVGRFENGLAKVAGAKGFGLVDVDGGIVIQPAHRWLERCASMTAVGDDGQIDVYAPDSARLLYSLPGEALEMSLVGECLSVAYPDRSCLYDSEGRLLVEEAAGAVFSPGLQGRFIVSAGAWGEICQWLIDPDGLAASGRFQQLLPLCDGRYAWLKMDGIEYYSEELGTIQKSWNYADMRYGLADEDGRIIAPAVWREIRALGARRLLLVGDGAVRLADINGVALREWLTDQSEAPTDEADS